MPPVVSYSSAPTSVRSLEQRIRNVESSDGLALRRRVGMALVVVGQMLPEGVVKGGSAMALRYGRGTRFTQDLDAARVQPLAEFRSDFEDSLAAGWAGFTGRLVEKAAPRPPAVPRAYVMQPFEVKLDYRGRSWCTVKFELGHNEIGDADEPEYQLAADLAGLFTEVGLPAPKAVPVMRSDHQVAQKLHAVTDEGSERARDLVDLQLLDKLRKQMEADGFTDTQVQNFGTSRDVLIRVPISKDAETSKVGERVMASLARVGASGDPKVRNATSAATMVFAMSSCRVSPNCPLRVWRSTDGLRR